MINTNMADIQTNKPLLNKYNTQMSTQKKINRPSEDPIIAIRALRLRTSLDQVSMYLDKNIPDASSWLDTTEGALDEGNSIITKLYGYCEQGATDSYSSEQRQTISETLSKLKEAFYAEEMLNMPEGMYLPDIRQIHRLHTSQMTMLRI